MEAGKSGKKKQKKDEENIRNLNISAPDQVEVEQTQHHVATAGNILKRTSGIDSMLHKTHPNNFNIFAETAAVVDGGEAGMKKKPTNMLEGVSRDGGLNSKTSVTTLQQQNNADQKSTDVSFDIQINGIQGTETEQVYDKS